MSVTRTPEELAYSSANISSLFDFFEKELAVANSNKKWQTGNEGDLAICSLNKAMRYLIRLNYLVELSDFSNQSEQFKSEVKKMNKEVRDFIFNS